MVETAFLDKLENQEAVRPSGTVDEDPDDVRVPELPEGLHLGPELPEPLEGVGAELLDGNSGTGGESGLVDEPEAAVADDEVRREIPGRLDEIGHGDPVERPVKRGALADGDGGEIRIGNRSGSRLRVLLLASFAEADDHKENYGYNEEARYSGEGCLEN